MLEFKKLLMAAALGGGVPPVTEFAGISRGMFAWSTGAIGATKDFTIPGIGTPKAIMLMAVENVGTQSPTPYSSTGFGSFAVGYADGTDQVCNGFASEDARNPANCGRNTIFDGCIMICNPNGAAASPVMGFNSWITDGVRLEVVTSGATATLFEIVFFYGDDITNAKVIQEATGATTGVTSVNIGFEPDLLLLGTNITNSGFVNDNSVTSHFSMGACVNDGLDSQGAWGLRAADNVSPTDISVVASETKAIITSATSGNDPILAVHIENFGATGFDMDVSGLSVANREILGLAIEFSDAVEFSLFPITLSATGTYAETAPGCIPTWGLMSLAYINVGFETIDRSAAGAYSLTSFDVNGISTHAMSDSDGVTTSDVYNLEAGSFRTLVNGGSVNVVSHGFGLTVDGWEVEISAIASTVIGYGIAVGPGVLSDIPDPLLHYTLDDSTQGTTVDSSGNGYTGSYSGTPTLEQPPIFADGGFSILCDGTDDRVIGPGAYTSATVASMFPVVVSGHYNFTDMVASRHGLFTTNYNSVRYRGVAAFVTSAGHIRVVIGSGLRNTGAYRVWTAIPTPVLTSGTDYHIAIKLTDNETLVVTVDGVSIPVGTYSDGAAFTGMGIGDGVVVIGHAQDGSSSTDYRLKGKADDFRIVLADLTVDQMAALGTP